MIGAGGLCKRKRKLRSKKCKRCFLKYEEVKMPIRVLRW